MWLSFLIAGAIAGLQGYSFARLGARYPTAGGLLEHVAKGFGDGHFTGITAWLTYSANAIVTAMVAVSFGSYASSMFTGGNAGMIKVFAALIIIVMTAVNVIGSELVARAQTVIVYVVLDILTLFAVVTLVNMDLSLLAPSGYPPLREIVSSVALTFFAFLGFGIIISIASIGSIVALLIFTLITAAHFRVRAETGASAAVLAVAIAAAAVVLATFVFTILIHEPASIAALLIIIVLSVVLDFWWKRARTSKAKHVSVEG